MFKVLVAIVALWALMTSGVSVADLADAVLRWAADHVQITLRLR